MGVMPGGRGCLLGPALGGAQGRCSFLRVLTVGSHLPLCPSAPLGSWRWASDGLVAPAMGLGEVRAGRYLGPSIHHGLSSVLCGRAQEPSAHNSKNCAISTHTIISLKIPMKTLTKIYLLELLHSTQLAMEVCRPGVGGQCSYSTSPRVREGTFLSNASS